MSPREVEPVEEVEGEEEDGMKARKYSVRYIQKVEDICYPFGFNPSIGSTETECYGLIVKVVRGYAYILCRYGLVQRKIATPPEQDQYFGGCWIKFCIQPQTREITRIIDAVEPPIHSKILEPGKFARRFWVYDFVTMQNNKNAFSDFLGTLQIPPDMELFGLKQSERFNAEYLVTVDENSSAYNTSVIKIHGTVEHQSELPRELMHNASMVYGSRSPSFYRDDARKMLLTEKEREELDTMRLNKQRERYVRRMHKELPYQICGPTDIRSCDEDESDEDDRGMYDYDPAPNKRQSNNVALGKPSSSAQHPACDSKHSSSGNSEYDENTSITGHRPQPIRRGVGVGDAARTVVITNASAGYGYFYAVKRLESGNNVVMLLNDPQNPEDYGRRMQKYGNKCSIYVDEYTPEFSKIVAEDIYKKYGTVDQLVHFATAICKPGVPARSYSNHNFIYKENILTFVNIHRALNSASLYHEQSSIMAVGPFSSDALKDGIRENLEMSMADLSLVMEEVASSSELNVDHFTMEKAVETGWSIGSNDSVLCLVGRLLSLQD